MNSTKNAPPQPQPLSVMLSALHLPPPISALHNLSGIEVSLPKSDTGAPKMFKAIVSESTTRNLLLKSLYDSNVRGKVFDKTEYVLSSLADQGISRCAFTTTFGMMAGQPSLNDRTAPQFKVDGGLAAVDPEAKPARSGYGIYFPTLPRGWDMYGALATSDNQTNQKAELTAIICALQLACLRKIVCEKISIFTDSKYAVQALNDWIPNFWRSNEYCTAKNRVVVNADLFRSLDEEVSLSIKHGIPVMLSHIPREQNKKADALSKLGAASEKGVEAESNSGSPQDGRPHLLLGKDLFKEMKPLVQWTPDGVYWVRLQSTGEPSESIELGIDAVLV